MQNAFFMSFIHKYVSPVCQGTHKVSENTTISIFLRAQISKNGGITELIQIVGWLCTHGPIRNFAIRDNARVFWT